MSHEFSEHSETPLKIKLKIQNLKDSTDAIGSSSTKWGFINQKQE